MLFGGIKGGLPSQEHWEFGLINGIPGQDDWYKVFATDVPPPPGRVGHSLIYDREAHEMVMFGGSVQNSGVGSGLRLTGETFRLRGSSWAVDSEAGPPARQNALAAYNALDHDTVLVGGDLDGLAIQLVENGDELVTWKLNGTTWTQNVPATTVPGDRSNMMSSYDTENNRLLMFGGTLDQIGADTKTWSFDGHQWAPLSTGDAPPVRSGGAMSFDSSSGHSVLFGGVANSVLLDDTWVLAGNDWTRLSTTTSPSPRSNAAMSYDAGRDRTVLFGGNTEGGFVANDTWLFDGEDWSELVVPTGTQVPSPRENAAMTYDPIRDRIVMFGGFGSGPLDDTWEFDGTQWFHIDAQQHPPARSGHGLSYIRSASLVLLHGGFVGGTSSNNADSDTWAYVGTQWTPLASVPTTDSIGKHLFSDSPIGPFVFGGVRQSDTPESIAWAHKFVSFLDPEICALDGDEDGDALSDCDDPDCDGLLCGLNSLTCIGGVCSCPTGLTQEADCSDGIDDDCDGLVDCDDVSDCGNGVVCGAESVCNDNIDNDGDDLMDCKDPGCFGEGQCQQVESSCNDSFDNDADDLIDCLDPNCSLNGAC